MGWGTHRLILLSIMALFGGCSDKQWNSAQQGDREYQTYEIKAATYNLKFFGTAGGFNKSIEPRTQRLQSFVDQELGDVDVILFSEVMNLALFKKTIGQKWQCEGYDRESIRHHHLVLCYNAKKWTLKKYDSDFEIPEQAMGSFGLRPAIQAKLCGLDGGHCFLQILGVHLKAGPKTDYRLEQMQIITNDLQIQGNILPTLILGDFNSYRKDRTGKEKDDMELFLDQLATGGYAFKSLSSGVPTYGTGEWGRDYDQMLVTNNITGVNIRAYPSCGKNIDISTRHIPYAQYRNNFSDHCYIRGTLRIKTKKEQSENCSHYCR